MRLSCYEEEVVSPQHLTANIRNQLSFLTYDDFQGFICSIFGQGFYLQAEKEAKNVSTDHILDEELNVKEAKAKCIVFQYFSILVRANISYIFLQYLGVLYSYLYPTPNIEVNELNIVKDEENGNDFDLHQQDYSFYTTVNCFKHKHRDDFNILFF